jgi:hypothetical protein
VVEIRMQVHELVDGLGHLFDGGPDTWAIGTGGTLEIER